MQPAERQQLLDDVENFCRELRPHEDRCYLERRFSDQVFPLARKYNLLGMPVPREYGGREVDAVTYAEALARIGREGSAVRTIFSGHSSIGQYPIITWGTAEQKRRYLPDSVEGKTKLAFGLTEPEAGSNPLELRMTYRRQGDQFLLSGEKYLITNGAIADVVIMFAYPEGGAGRISAFIVEAGGSGFVAEEMFPKIGMPTANTGWLKLSDYAVPVENLLGGEGNGFRVAMGTLVSGRLSVAAGCLGVIEDCLIEAIAYAKGRQQHGKPIAMHQLIQEHLAAIEMHRLATEAIVLRAAEAKRDSQLDPADEPIGGTVDLLSAQAKLFAAQAAWDAADRAVQVLGGRGFLQEYRPGRHLCDVRVCRLYEGTDEILKLKIAAALLGKEYQAYR